jgi:hypothetical protein
MLADSILAFSSTRHNLSVTGRNIPYAKLVMLDCSIESSLWEILCFNIKRLVEQEVNTTAHVVKDASATEFLKNTPKGLSRGCTLGACICHNGGHLLSDKPGSLDQTGLMAVNKTMNPVEGGTLPACKVCKHHMV